MRIRLTTGGKVESVSKEGRVRIDDFRMEDWGDYNDGAQVNSHSEIDWTFELGAGDRRTLTYEVSFYR